MHVDDKSTPEAPYFLLTIFSDQVTSKENEEIIAKAKDDELPAAMKGMSVPQREMYVKEKSEERAKIQSEIQSLNKKRQEYIASNTPKEVSDSSLDAAMIKAVKEKAIQKNLNF